MSLLLTHHILKNLLLHKKNSKSQHRKTRVHPAANFTAESSDSPSFLQPEAQTIKEMLAEVKNSVHSGDAENDIAENDNYAPSFEQSECGSERPSFDDSAVENQNDNIPAALKAYLRTPEQKQAEIDAIKAESRLRWLAFYYLSRVNMVALSSNKNRSTKNKTQKK